MNDQSYQEKIYIRKVNEVHMHISAEHSVLLEIQEFFSFRPPGYQFNPMFKHKQWDGWIRIFRPISGLLHVGLISYMKKFARRGGYDIVFEGDFDKINSEITDDYGHVLAQDTKFTARDYQNTAVVTALREGRQLLLSPTASGKSFIVYLLSRYHINQDERVLIIVPTISLVSQMANDFVDYGYDMSNIHKILGGVDKDQQIVEITMEDGDVVRLSSNDKIAIGGKKTKLAGKLSLNDNIQDVRIPLGNIKTIKVKPYPVVISTWQSLQKISASWVNSFGALIGDEAHLCQAKSLTTLFDKASEVSARYGLTGTLGGDSKCHRLVLEGIFGNVTRVEETINLINNGTLADLKVKGLVLHYSDAERKEISKLPYAQQREWVFAHDKRNKFIRNLAAQGKDQNTLIMFELVQKHGKILEPYLRQLESKGFKIHFIWGSSSVEEREDVRRICEESVNNIILASSKIFSTGVNIKRLHTLIFAAANKSRVTVLQSIGRLLRKIVGADKVTCYDITDDLTWKSKSNYSLTHFYERVKIYLSEGFDATIYNIELTGPVKISQN